MSAEHIQAMRAGLAAQVTTYDEGGLRLHVTRREARVDVAFETVTPEGAVRHPDMEPLWALTALLCDEGLRLVEQEMGSGEDATQLFPTLARHLAERPVAPMVDPTDERYLRVGAYDLRARRFNRGVTESVRVDLRVSWKDGAPDAWLHVFDGELVFHPLGGSPSLRVTAESEVFSPAWGQVEHLVRFATYAALLSEAASADVLRQLGETVAWGDDVSLWRSPSCRGLSTAKGGT